MSQSKGVRKMTLTAIVMALSVVTLLAAAYAPSGRLGIVAVAGLLSAAVVASAGWGAGVFCWAGTGLLAFFLLPAKECILLYALMFGPYPVIKHWIERLKPALLRWLLKLAVFYVLMSVLYLGFQVLFLSAAFEPWLEAVVIYIGGGIFFVVYDLCMTGFTAWFQKRVAPWAAPR